LPVRPCNLRTISDVPVGFAFDNRRELVAHNRVRRVFSRRLARLPLLPKGHCTSSRAGYPRFSGLVVLTSKEYVHTFALYFTQAPAKSRTLTTWTCRACTSVLQSF
jgi:hypothetical protein